MIGKNQQQNKNKRESQVLKENETPSGNKNAAVYGLLCRIVR
jgi:hypothetical protein